MFSNRELRIKNQELLRDVRKQRTCMRQVSWENGVEQSVKELIGHGGFALNVKELGRAYNGDFRLQEMPAWGRHC